MTPTSFERLTFPVLTRGGRRVGVTLIEVIVVLGIIGTVASLLSPAVQRARDAARRAACSNNLRQLNLAVHLYESIDGLLPPLMGTPIYPEDGRVEHRQFSIFTQLLPHIEQSSLFNAINFQVEVYDPYLFDLTRGRESAANRTVMATVLGVLICPADGSLSRGWTGGTSYRANHGTERWHLPEDSPFITMRRPMPLASTTDGLANTAFLGEKIRGAPSPGRFNARTDIFEAAIGIGCTIEEAVAVCSRSRSDTPWHGETGLTWFVGTLSQTTYNHILTPNSRIPDCMVGLPSVPIAGLIALRSNHDQVVSVAFGDGSVRFVTGSIDRNVWVALGSRNGGEVVSFP